MPRVLLLERRRRQYSTDMLHWLVDCRCRPVKSSALDRDLALAIIVGVLVRVPVRVCSARVL